MSRIAKALMYAGARLLTVLSCFLFGLVASSPVLLAVAAACDALEASAAVFEGRLWLWWLCVAAFIAVPAAVGVFMESGRSLDK